MKQIIAFVGPIGCGKTVAADYLVEHFGFVKINFKGALIAEIKQNFPDLLEVLKLTSDYETTNELFTKKPYLPEIRALMQNYGTEVRRKDNSEYWVDWWWDIAKSYDKVVIDDLRFLNEFESIKQAGGTVYRLHRDETENKSTHVSETDQEKFNVDRTIENNHSEEDLYKQLDDLMTL